MALFVRSGHMPNAILAAFQISQALMATALGSPWPPYLGGQGKALQPPSANWR